MTLKLLALLASSTAWVSTLWFGIELDFAQWSIGALVAIHLAPPLLAWGTWRLFLGYRDRRRARQAEAKEAAQAVERAEALAAARRRHEEEVADRQFHCECLWLGLRVKAAQPGALPEVDLPNARCYLQPAEPDPEDDELGIAAYSQQEDAIGGFAPQLYETLLQLYDDSPAASFLPLLVVPPCHLAVGEVAAGLRRIHGEIVAAMDPRPALPDDSPVIRFLPHGQCAVNAVLSLFQSDPGLPGAVVLAFDSPLAFGGPAASAAGDSGQASQGIVALLLVAPGVAAALALLGDEPLADPSDALTPYWEKEWARQFRFKLLAKATSAACKTLLGFPVLAQIRRAEARLPVRPDSDCPADPILELKLQLERAGANAGLLPLPFAVEGAGAAAPEKLACGWLTHNAGNGRVGSSRLAALSAAFAFHGVPVDPLDQGTNTAKVLGDVGAATTMGMLAMTVLRCAELDQPVLCADLAMSDGGVMFFAVPAPKAAPETCAQ